MVGFGSGSNSSPALESRPSVTFPPPPYKEDSASVISPVLLSETTTTTKVVTTTTQTTRFFTLPLWSRRRTTAASSPTHKNMFGMGMDEHGVISRPVGHGTLMLEKDLPPTPDDADSPSNKERVLEHNGFPEAVEPSKQRTSAMRPSTSSAAKSQTASDCPRPSIPTISLPMPPSTYVLAQAALGIGLPHATPTASTPPIPDGNSVTFMSPSTQPTETHLSVAIPRRVKSSQKLRASSSEEEPLDRKNGDYLMGRRTRGLSLGPASFLHFTSDNKGKDREVDGKPQVSTITRKPSFWSRKRSEPAPPLPISPSSSQRFRQPLLPSVPPVTPFNLDMQLSPTPPPHEPQAASLSRSRSDRASSSTAALPREENLGTSPNDSVSKRRPRRPATADASSRSRARSLFVDLPSFSPAPNPKSTPLSQPPDSPRPSTSSASHTHTSRPRAQTNPPLLHRLSANLFSTSPVSADSNGILGTSITSSPIGSTANSPRPSLNKPPVEIPKPQTDAESPELYLRRLLAAVSKAEVAGILASSGDPFYARALQAYIDQFNFIGDPLDVALRKLLMDVGLPRETQQIDRVMEAFARRYLHCNPSLFTSDDHPYILAFSLIMLHTDAFNKSNKRKMSKPDYVKNTRLPGIAPEVLDCFYDNIVFAPFIFIEDPLDVNGQRGVMSERKLSTFGSATASPINGSVSILGKGSKIDPYYLIMNNLLGPLRVNIEVYVPRENPYLHEGTAGRWDDEEIRRSFATATVVEVGANDNQRMASPFFGLSVGGVPSPILGNSTSFQNVQPSNGEIWSIKVTKVGLLNRKDDILEGGKKASNRKWRAWSLILTGSQLLLFRDPAWAAALLAHSQSDGQVIFPQASLFKPDELLSVKDAIAVFDKSYTKYENTLRLVLADGRHILFQTSNEKELNEWISRINYASAFKTTGVRMRALGMSGRDLELTGVAAATSHLHDQQAARQSRSTLRSWDRNVLQDVASSSPDSPTLRSSGASPLNRSVTMLSDRSDVESNVPIAPEIEGALEFKATFDEVKAELAAGHRTSSEDEFPAAMEDGPGHARTTAVSSAASSGAASQLPSRSRIIQSKVHDLESRLAAAQSQLDSDLRFVRNIATLTPFQRTTRDRLQVAVQNVSKRIMQVRLDISKLVCHRDILLNDLAGEEREWSRAKKTALRAATKTLQREKSIPRMTISLPTDDTKSSLLTIPRDDAVSHRAESSVCESFHSALDFGPEWLASSEDLTSSDLSNTSHFFDSPVTATPGTEGGSSSRGSFPFPEVDANVSLRNTSFLSLDRIKRTSSGTLPSPGDGDEGPHHEKFYTAPDIPDEQAEEWNKTRCAKRVSLVRVPSDLRLLSRSTRHEKGDSQTVLEETGSSRR